MDDEEARPANWLPLPHSPWLQHTPQVLAALSRRTTNRSARREFCFSTDARVVRGADRALADASSSTWKRAPSQQGATNRAAAPRR
jgi:hypothetical protein